MEQEIKVIEVKMGDEVRKIEVRKPTPKVDAEANMASSKVFAKLIKEKGEDNKAAFILRSQLNSYLAKILFITQNPELRKVLGEVPLLSFVERDMQYMLFCHDRLNLIRIQ